MKAVLMSIQPKWCELIASGKKTVEVRKTKPKLETPFKCYIYCTNGDSLNYLRHSYFDNYQKFWVDNKAFGANVARANGKIIGEFVCDKITEYECSSDGFGELATTCGTCLTYDEIINYCNGNSLYAWHISDLVIYDEPKELEEFEPYCNGECTGCKYLEWIEWYHSDTCMRPRLKKPPQSWRYVDEITK